MSKLIYSVKDIFTTYLNESKYEYFNIPDYQRGYKWDENDVRKLLEDLKKFEESNTNKDSFYCLQNITLVPSKDNDNKDILNVVDGQQRLTTLFILLSYFKNVKTNELKNLKNAILKYSIRTDTADKLHDLFNNKENIWNKDALNPSNAQHRDEFYILTVAQEIKKWFKDEKNISPKFYTIWEKTPLIVNKLEGKTEEKVFANINSGKVPLDGADLVRAVLMTKSAKEKTPDSAQKTNEFRVRMGMEIDNINRWWSDKNVQEYYQQFLPDELGKDSDFNQKEYPISLLYKIFYEINKDRNIEKKFSFEFFEYGTNFDNNTNNNFFKMYKEIISLHLTLQDWYNNQEIYHLLGYLIFNFKNNISLWKIWNEKWNQSDSKFDFIRKLKKLISFELEKLVENDQDNKKTNINKKKILLEEIQDIQSNWYGNPNTEKILLLMDIIHFFNKKDDKLPVSFFRTHNEQKEHIMCQHPRKNGEKEELTVTEASSFIDSLKLSGKDTEFKNSLQTIININAETIDSNKKLSSSQIKNYEQELHNYCLNSIGNIVLLNSSINESYGNAPHNEKVKRITSEFFGNNHYIRPFTASVFLEKDSKNIKKQWRWGIEEIRENAKNISSEISKFLGLEE